MIRILEFHNVPYEIQYMFTTKWKTSNKYVWLISAKNCEILVSGEKIQIKKYFSFRTLFSSLNIKSDDKNFHFSSFVLVLVFNWRDILMSRPAPKQGSFANRQLPTEFYCSGNSRQVFLTRLVQNLTLRNDCNLIPSAHGTQHLSSQIDHWTKGFTSPKVSYSKVRSKMVKWGVERCTAFAVSSGSPCQVRTHDAQFRRRMC